MMTRKFTSKILDLVDEGLLNKEQLIRDLLEFMGEGEVEEFYDSQKLENWEEEAE